MKGYALCLEKVTGYDQALSVALIRNECRKWMTHNTKALDVGQQLAFFHCLLNNKRTELFILRVHPDRVPCGYALVSKKGRKAWLTAGVAIPFRGKGFGRWTFQELIKMYHCYAIWLEVLRTNHKAIRLYKSLGFVTRKTTSRIYVMQYDPTAQSSNR